MRAKTPPIKIVRQRRSPGAVLRIPMGDWHTYAWMLNLADMAFLDARAEVPLSPEQAVARPILFRVAVMKRAYNTGRWRKIGVVPIPPELARPVPKFIYDQIARTLSISEDGGIRRPRPATLAECQSLEC